MEPREVVFKPVTRENWLQLTKLDVLPEQYDFLAKNSGLYVLAYSAMYPGWDNFAIYFQNNMVGFLSCRYSIDHKMEVCTIQHFFIDGRYQGKGIGKASAVNVLEKVRRIYPMAGELHIQINQDNKQAAKLLKSLDFTILGNVSALGNVFLIKKI
jgi:RimJ/RimL family protein N-acetyltransferase